MMRVLQVMAGAAHGGAEAFFERLVTALHKRGLSQRVLLRPVGGREKRLQDEGIPVATASFGGPLDLKTHYRFRRQVQSFRPHVVLTWMNRATRFTPTGPFVHVARLGGYYSLKYYTRCDHLVGNTEDITAYLVQAGWLPERVHYLPNFVRDETHPPVERKTYYTPSDAPLVVALGRLHENKGFDVLIRALQQVPEAYCWLAGEGPLRADLEKQAAALGVKPRFRFLGWRTDTPALLAAADMLVCPSRHEPLGNVVLEGWAQGVPVIAADSEGPAALISSEKNGLLVPRESASDLAAAINRLASVPEDRRRLGEEGRRSYEARFTRRRVVAAYMDFFQQVVAAPPPEKAGHLPPLREDS